MNTRSGILEVRLKQTRLLSWKGYAKRHQKKAICEGVSESQSFCAAEIDMEEHLRGNGYFVALTRIWKKGRLKDMETLNGEKSIRRHEMGQKECKWLQSSCKFFDSLKQARVLTTTQKKRLHMVLKTN